MDPGACPCHAPCVGSTHPVGVWIHGPGRLPGGSMDPGPTRSVHGSGPSTPNPHPYMPRAAPHHATPFLTPGPPTHAPRVEPIAAIITTIININIIIRIPRVPPFAPGG
jgi:hypothetical protein